MHTSRVLTTGANPCHDSGADHKVRILGCSLQRPASKREQRASEQAIDPSDPVGKPTAAEAPEDRAQIIYTDDAALVGGVGDRPICPTDANLCHVGWRGVDTAHDTLVIALEEDRDERENLDGHVQLTRRKPRPYRPVSHHRPT